MVWDSDINPEGAFEKFKYSLGNADFFVSAGQFDYQNVNPANQFLSADLFLLAWQAGATVNLAKDEAFKIAPAVYNYTGHGSGVGLNTPFVGQGDITGMNPNNAAAVNQNGVNDLLIIEVPGELTFPVVAPWLGSFEGRLFGDFAYNIEGDDRADAAFHVPGAFFNGPKSPVTGQNKAYQVGLGIGSGAGVYDPVYGPTQGLVYGSTSKKGTWEIRGYWQHIEQYSLDVNLIDSDFFEGRANLEGFYAAVAYSFTDGIIGTLRYGHASRINDGLGTGGNNLDIPLINPINNYNLFQADLTWRF